MDTQPMTHALGSFSVYVHKRSKVTAIQAQMHMRPASLARYGALNC